VEPLDRGLKSVVEVAWRSSPVVVLQGPRAVGKTTLVRGLERAGSFHDLSSDDELRQVETSPRAWIESLPFGTVIDECQRLPSLPIDVKRMVDSRSGVPGQFLLTGSVRMRTDQLGGSDPLVGRAIRLDLLPFAQCELLQEPLDIMTELFDGNPASWNLAPTDQSDMIRRCVKGGMPFMRTLQHEDGGSRLLQNYVDSQFNGEAAESTRDVVSLRRLFRWLCASAGQIRDYKKFGDPNEINAKVVPRLIEDLLRQFLVTEIKPWHPLQDRRESHKPRLFPIDSAFVADQIGMSSRDQFLGPAGGSLLETFAANEIARLLTWSAIDGTLFHWRKDDTHEVDLIVEDRRSGRLLAIEVKSDREPKQDYFSGIRAFRAQYPDRNIRGIVLHCADNVVRHTATPDDWFLPFSALWQAAPLPQATGPKRSLADALADVRRKIGGDQFVDPSTTTEWVQQAERHIESVVRPLLENIAETVQNLGFATTITATATAKPYLTTMARSDTRFVGIPTRLEIRSNSISPPRSSWLIEVGCDVLTNGTTNWSVFGFLGGQREDFGPPVTLRNENTPRSVVEEGLITFVDALPRLIETWSNLP
jgi:uncharacterized protein